MDPQLVLSWVIAIRQFIEEYGGLAGAYVSKAYAFLVYVISNLPDWFVRARAFLDGLMALIETHLGG
jgi:hypothetical protein